MMALGKQTCTIIKTRVGTQSCKTMKIVKIYKIENDFIKIINKKS
jgi:hypothetical protein